MNKLIEIIERDAEKILTKVNLEEIRNKTILLTGASGLIGTYLLACLKKLAEKGEKNFKTVVIMQNAPLPHLKSILDSLEAIIFQGDITDYNFCQSLPAADYIIHAAGYGQPGKFMENPIKTLRINTFSTFILFEKLLPNGKFLFISSSEVYSGLPNSPYKESTIGTTNTDHQRSCYIEAKRCGEAICNVYRQQGINAKSARLALAYGPGTKPGDTRVLNSFIQKAIQQKEIKLLDLGEGKRTYCYVADAVEIIWRILLDGKDAIYNVGGISRTTIAELARLIGDYLNVPVHFPNNTNTTLSGAPNDVYLDLDKIKSEFNKVEFVPLNIGLEKTIEWQKLLYKSK